MSKEYRFVTLSSLKRIARLNEKGDKEILVELTAKIAGSPEYWNISFSDNGIQAIRDNPWYHPEWSDSTDAWLYEHPSVDQIRLDTLIGTVWVARG